MKTEGLALALTLCASAAGCATMTRGTSQDFTVESTPAGAHVHTSNGFECPSTPCTFHMPRKTGFTVDVTKDGYQPGSATVTSSMSGAGGTALAGNILIGGIIGAGVDATSGALNDLRPNPLHFDLVEEEATPAEAPVATPVVAEQAVTAAAVTPDAAAVEATTAPPAAVVEPAVTPAASSTATPH